MNHALGSTAIGNGIAMLIGGAVMVGCCVLGASQLLRGCPASEKFSVGERYALAWLVVIAQAGYTLIALSANVLRPALSTWTPMTLIYFNIGLPLCYCGIIAIVRQLGRDYWDLPAVTKRADLALAIRRPWVVTNPMIRLFAVSVVTVSGLAILAALTQH